MWLPCVPRIACHFSTAKAVPGGEPVLTVGSHLVLMPGSAVVGARESLESYEFSSEDESLGSRYLFLGVDPSFYSPGGPSL
jgi:hypothetical protein